MNAAEINREVREHFQPTTRRLITGTDSHTRWVPSRDRLYELLIEAEYDTSLSKDIRYAASILRLAILDETDGPCECYECLCGGYL